MPRIYGWEATDHEQGSGGGLFLKMEKGNTYKIRLVGEILSYYQYWKPIVCRSPYKDDEGNVICPLMLSGEEPPKIRFCTWVMDRQNGGRLKIMDFPSTVFSAFKEWRKATGIEPGGQAGPDWSITVEDQKGFTKYMCTALVQTPFTPDEMREIEEGNLMDRLVEVRKDNTPEEIRAMMAEKGITSNVAPSKVSSRMAAAPKAAQKAAPTQARAPAQAPPVQPPVQSQGGGVDEELDF